MLNQEELNTRLYNEMEAEWDKYRECFNIFKCKFMLFCKSLRRTFFITADNHRISVF